jgi:type IV pilus assembly protein PilY1
MKPKHQFVVFVAALGTLLAGAASGNTPLATLPLKASALALPNVIIGMDDSGSMDWEALLDTSSGVIWWNGSSAWDPATNKPLTGDASFAPYAYLFPLGTAEGAAIYPADSRYGQAAPPIRQLAWTRSAMFNPSYYNPLVTYRPWGAAYVGGNFKAGYPNATPAAAPSHPAVAGAPTLALGSPWNSASANFTAAGFRFYVQQGMVLPAGTRVLSTSAGAGGTPCSGAEVDLTSEQTVGAGSACWASIPYVPATYWHAEDCVLGDDCVDQPDGSGRLKRYEIRATTPGYPSGRSYADELQNFANWFTYYRKRKLMLAAAMTEVLGGTSGLRLGVVPFNVNAMSKIVEADGAVAADNRYFTAGLFHLNSMVANGTPTHQVMKNIAAQFELRNADAGKDVVQYACQRNAMFVVTDGFSNTATTEVPDYNRALYGGAPPYATTPVGSLADLALLHYTQRLRGDLPAGRVQPGDPTVTNADLNTNLHINTYALTLGVRGTLWPSANDPFAVPPAWPEPVGDTPLMIDDLWHATINGRGKMYLAENPEQTAASIRAGLQDILSGKATQGGVAVNTVNLARSDGFAYAASYNPAGWSGDLEAFAVSTATGSLAGARSWSASAKLAAKPLAERVIATWNGTGGTPFQAGTVGALVNPGDQWGNTAAVMSYLRGNRAGEGSTFRARTGLMGAVISAEPVIDREHQVAYLATGEGMLHAFDLRAPGAGEELWAYVPGPQLANMGQISALGYSFRTRLDGTPVLRTTDSGVKLLVSGMGAAGRGYFAIDVTQPRGLTEPGLAGKVLWEFPASGDAATAAKMGHTVGKPAIVKLASGTSVVLVTSGYNNTADGKGRLWVLNASTGNVIKEFVTPDGAIGAEAGLAQVSPMAEPDGSVRFVYGGDLLGNVWRFDLSMEPIAAGAVNRIAQLRDGANNPQPVTAAPELLAWQGQRIVMVGTGRLLDSTDFGSNRVHSIYAISDGATLPGSARQSLVARTINVAGDGTITGADVDWKTQRGWYADLPAGEHVNTRPVLAYGALAFVANQTGGQDCSASSRLYLIDAVTGNKVEKASFVTSVLSATSNSSGLTALLTKDGQTIRFVTRDYAGGKSIEREMSAGVAVQPAKNSWREIRR